MRIPGPAHPDIVYAACVYVGLPTFAFDPSSSAGFEALKPHFGEAEIGWLTMAAVLINSWNRIAISSRAQYDRALFQRAKAVEKSPEPA